MDRYKTTNLCPTKETTRKCAFTPCCSPTKYFKDPLMEENGVTPVKRLRNRFVNRYGDANVSLKNIPSYRRSIASDLFTTLVNLKWRWTTATFVSIFLVCWLVFSVLFFINCVIHDDFSDHSDDPNWEPCIANVHSFIGVFMYSFESQTTIGYGYRYPTEFCPLVWMITCVQNLVGVMLQGMLVGIIFAKLARPKKRAHTILFSNSAVVCMRDGKLCFLFRVGDLIKTQLIEAHIRLQMIKSRVTAEGEHIPYNLYEMNIGYDVGLDRIFTIFPLTICHVIDEKSPFYGIGPEELADPAKNRFEIVVILEGSVESVGSTVQCVHSYISSDIVWGHRFETMVAEEGKTKGHVIDYSLFHSTSKVLIPKYSAQNLDQMKEEGVDLTQAHKVDLATTPITPCDEESPLNIKLTTLNTE